jgi:hypothetical protein
MSGNSRVESFGERSAECRNEIDPSYSKPSGGISSSPVRNDRSAGRVPSSGKMERKKYEHYIVLFKLEVNLLMTTNVKCEPHI